MDQLSFASLAYAAKKKRIMDTLSASEVDAVAARVFRKLAPGGTFLDSP